MKKLLLILTALLYIGIAQGQTSGTFYTNLYVQKVTPVLFLTGANAAINFNSDVTFTLNSNLLTIGGGNLSLGANSLLGTGSIGATGTGRFLKGWFTDIDITNAPRVNGVSIFSNPTFTGTTTISSLNLGGTLITSTAAQINKLTEINASATELNYSLGLSENIQNALNSKTSSYNTILTGLTSVEKLQVGTSANAITIEGVTDVGQGYTFTKDGAELPPKIPDANQININTIAVMLAELSGSLTDGIPTDAQIDAIIGTTPALKGAGYKVTIKDTDGTGLLYFIESDGTNWLYIAFTKAL